MGERSSKNTRAGRSARMADISPMASNLFQSAVRLGLVKRMALISAILLGIYVSGLGPAWRLHATGHLPQALFLGAYGQMIKFFEESPPPMHALFDRYMRLWYDYR